MKLAELPQVQRLSPREKLELLGELWESLVPDLEEVEVSVEEKGVLDKRWSNFLRNPDSALTVDQFREKMNARRG